MPTLILASNSPRRRELLTQARVPFAVVAPTVSESCNPSLSVREITILNATRKSNAVAASHDGAIVLGADTLVSLDGRIIGKPSDMRDAERILEKLSGREHQVWTAVALRCAGQCLTNTFCVISHVEFHSLGIDRIRAYLSKINPLDKAGAYAAQGDGAEIIRRIRGSYTNVVGLPMDETLAALAPLGIKPA